MTPSEYCAKVWRAAESQGAELTISAAVSLEWDGNHCKRVILYSREYIEVSKLVLAAGPWSGHLAEDLFDGLKMPMTGIKSTSIVYENNEVVQVCIITEICES